MFNILIAEPNDELREVISANLEQIGINVFQAKDGIEAVEVLERNHLETKFNILVMETRMPRMNGFELFRHLTNATWKYSHKFDDISLIFFSTPDKTKHEEKIDIYWSFGGSHLYAFVSKSIGLARGRGELRHRSTRVNSSPSLYGSTNACQESIVNLLRVIQECLCID